MQKSGRRRAIRGRRPRPCLRRPPIAHGFLHRCAALVAGRLRSSAPSPWWGLRLLLDDHVPSTGTERQRSRRADLVESIVVVVTCLLARMDLKSLRVGFPAGRGKKHDFVGLSRFTIAGWCGLDESTVSRVLSLLRRASLVHGPARDAMDPNRIAQPYDGDDEKWLPAVRRIDELFFAGLGVGRELHLLRTAEPQRPRSAEQAQAARSARGVVDGIISRLGRPPDS